jgi:hypothetical protein
VSNRNGVNGSNFKPEARPDNKPKDKVDNKPKDRVDNKPNNRPNTNVNRPNNNKPNNGNSNRNNKNNKNNKKLYIGSKDGIGGARPAPKPAPIYNRSDRNRYRGYTPFRDGRTIHRPAPIVRYYDFGSRVTVRPRNYYKVRVSGIRLYFWDGVWYRYNNGYYGVYRPPVGAVIPLSYIYSSLYPVDFEYNSGYNGTTYYVDSYSNFYVQINNREVRVVNAPLGAVLYDMPSDYSEVVYNGIVYYRVGNSIFEYVYNGLNSWYFCAVGLYR